MTPMDSIKDIVRSSVKVPEFDKHLKKARGHISRNVVEITIKMKTIVWKPLMIKNIIFFLIVSLNIYSSVTKLTTKRFKPLFEVPGWGNLKSYIFIVMNWSEMILMQKKNNFYLVRQSCTYIICNSQVIWISIDFNFYWRDWILWGLQNIHGKIGVMGAIWIICPWADIHQQSFEYKNVSKAAYKLKWSWNLNSFSLGNKKISYN